MHKKLFYGLIVAILAVMAALVHHDRVILAFQKPETGTALVPFFDVTATSAVTVEKDGKTQTFLKDKTDRWAVLEEDGGYVRDGTVERFLATLTTLKKDVPATRLTAFYAEENVDETSACLVSVMDGDGTAQAVLFVGKPFETVRHKGFFVRLKDDVQSWKTFSDVDLCLTLTE